MTSVNRWAALAAVAIGASACVLDNGGAPDAAVYDVPDAAPDPSFRDAGCGGGGASGTSGGGGSSGTSGAACGDAGGVSVPDASPDASPDAAPPCEVYTFVYDNASATTVWVTGSFTSWATTPASGAVALVNDGTGTWTKSWFVGSGRHTYKFIIDGSQWLPDPDNPMTEDDGVGGVNSVLELCGAPASG